MSENKWVEEALNDVVEAINAGSLKLKMNTVTEELVRALYRDLFAQKTEAEWRAARSNILALAGQAGRTSEIATLLMCVEHDKDPGTFLERDMVTLVCMAVSRMDCPLSLTSKDGAPLKGNFCPHVVCAVPKEKGLILDRILNDLGYN